MTPARTAFLRNIIAAKAEAHGKQLTGPAGEALLQAADAIRELAAESADLAALRIEHAAWGAIIDATRADRDAARAEVAALRAQVAEAADVARKAERADVVAWLRNNCDDPKHDPRWCPTCETRGDCSYSIESGAHEGAATPK